MLLRSSGYRAVLRGLKSENPEIFKISIIERKNKFPIDRHDIWYREHAAESGMLRFESWLGRQLCSQVFRNFPQSLGPAN
jgi:hypothetical protein